VTPRRRQGTGEGAVAAAAGDGRPGERGLVDQRRGPRAAGAVTGHVQQQIQHGRDGQADRGPTDHIQRVVRPRYTRATAFRIASTNATTAQRRGSTSASSPAMAKVMMACPETKLSPPGCTPRRIASPTVVPRTLPLDQPLDHPLQGELAGHHQHQRGRQAPAPKGQRADGHDQRHGQHPQVLEGEHGPIQPVGQPVDGVEGARSMGPTRPSAAITAHTANTARLATSTMTSRRPRLTAPPLRRRLVGRPTRPHRQPTGTDRKVSRLDAAHRFPRDGGWSASTGGNHALTMTS
jgi:hypothetical protein